MLPGGQRALRAVCDRGAPQLPAAAADTGVRVCLHSLNHGKQIYHCIAMNKVITTTQLETFNFICF